MNTLTALLAFASHITANWTPEESTILCTVHNHVDEGQDSLEQHRSETGCVRAPHSDETTSSTNASKKKAVRSGTASNMTANRTPDSSMRLCTTTMSTKERTVWNNVEVRQAHEKKDSLEQR